jgi:hypothetical protein
MFLNLLLSLIVGIICLMSWMFKRNLELDKDTQELVKKIIRTTELLNYRVSQIEEWINSQREVVDCKQFSEKNMLPIFEFTH